QALNLYLPPLRHILSLSFLFFQGSGPHRHLHSFPTRRSSDLRTILIATIGPADPAAMRTKLVEAFEPLESASRPPEAAQVQPFVDRKSTRLNSSHVKISYAVFCLKKKKKHQNEARFTHDVSHY